MSTASTSSSNGTSSFHSRPHSPAYHHPRQNNTPHQHRHQNHQHHLQNHVAPKHSSTSTSTSPAAHAHAHHRPSGPSKRSIASSSGLVASTKIKGMKSPEKRERERDRKRERQVGYNQQDLDLTRDTDVLDGRLDDGIDRVRGAEASEGPGESEGSVRYPAGRSGLRTGSGWEAGKEEDRSGWTYSDGHGCLPPTPTSATKFGSSGSIDPQLLPETPTRTPRGLSRDPGSTAILPQTPTSPVRATTSAPSISPRSLGYSFPTFKSSLSPPVIQDQDTGRGEAGAEQENAGRASLWLNKSEGGKKRDHREVELGSREGSPVGDTKSEKVQKDRGERTASWPRANGIDQGALPPSSRPRSDLGPMLTEQPQHHGFQGSKSDSHIQAPPIVPPERPRSIPSQPPSVPAAQMQNHPPHPRRMYAYNATSAEEEARRAILVDACEGLSSLCSQWHGSEYNKLKFGEKGRSRWSKPNHAMANRTETERS
jgi:hypothetical protein